MSDDRIDFSALDPTHDEARFERLVSAIVRDAEPELRRRRQSSSSVAQVGQWWWPLLAAAAVVIMASLGLLWRLGETPGASTSIVVESGIEESLGVPTQVASWIRGDQLPSTSDFLETIEVSQ
ncbi:MAG: hypothetical protein E4H37_03980 [Gemmatimonadales bacterium]|jgi:hypothetical protein|nr:MAG: hypothetical protein E4H37_03980 [Gemmatimonadales bacterium]